MDRLFASAKAFEKLLDVRYHIKLGRKNKLYELDVIFESGHFHHLMGLNKLSDIRISRENREKVFWNIIKQKTNFNDINKSRYISKIEDRFNPLLCIEQLLDSNDTMFRYNEKLNVFSLIEAEFIMST